MVNDDPQIRLTNCSANEAHADDKAQGIQLDGDIWSMPHRYQVSSIKYTPSVSLHRCPSTIPTLHAEAEELRSVELEAEPEHSTEALTSLDLPPRCSMDVQRRPATA